MIRAACLCAMALFAGAVQAHDLHYTAANTEATVLRLFYVDDKAFGYEAYEIYRAGDTLPYQVGRTDAQGRIAFLPDRAGDWRVKVFSEDGHGVDITLTTDAAAQLSALDKPFYERHARVLVGVALIFGLFGFVSLFVKRKSAV